MRVSAVVNTYNEEHNISRCLKSVDPYVDEIVVGDMHSVDKTVEMIRKFTDKVWQHEYVGYVEPARNFAISKAEGDWIFLIDADEVLPNTLGEQLRKLTDRSNHAFYRIPRRNFIFGKNLIHSGWWPDYQIRFFKKEAVSWNDEIHSIPFTHGNGTDLPAKTENALIHYHYDSIAQFLDRMNRYTTQEVRQLRRDGYAFTWKNVLTKPGNEFLTRFFAWEGYKDGFHGLALSCLQALSFLIVELKVWEADRFQEVNLPDFLGQFGKLTSQMIKDGKFWYFRSLTGNSHGLGKLLYKVRQMIRI